MWFGTIIYRANQALDRMNLSDVKLLYIDETSSKKDHSCVILVCDQDRRIIFIYEGKSSETMDRLAVWLRRTMKEEGISGSSAVISERCTPSGVRRNFPNVRIVYDEFHAWLIIETVEI